MNDHGGWTECIEKQQKVTQSELEDYLTDVLSKDFNVEAEDGSVQWVCEQKMADKTRRRSKMT